MSAPLAWSPPAGMSAKVTAEWRVFYSAIRTKYGMSPQDYRDLYVAQHGVCFICRSAKGKHPDDPKGSGGRRLGVDHNHVIGDGTRAAVRGLLCTGGDRTCNRIIGWLTLPQLQRAGQYVESAPAQQVFRRLERANGNGGGDAFRPGWRDAWLGEVLNLNGRD